MADKQTVEFEQLASKCCGLDVHKKEIVATVDGEGLPKETRTFSSTTRSLTELKDWLLELGVSHVAMESTGVYWKPVMNILEPGGFTILVVNARHIKYVPGHKTDKKDIRMDMQAVTCRFAERQFCSQSIPTRPARFDPLSSQAGSKPCR